MIREGRVIFYLSSTDVNWFLRGTDGRVAEMNCRPGDAGSRTGSAGEQSGDASVEVDGEVASKRVRNRAARFRLLRDFAEL